MKITDPEIIKTGERDLIDAVKEDLDWRVIGEIVKEKINLSSVESTGGQIVVHENQVAFQVDLVVKMAFSLMFDREGNLISDRVDPGQEQVGEVREHSLPETDMPAQEGILDPEPMAEEALETASKTGDHEDEALDDDIDEILKESRDFWENKESD